ncbi:endo-1,4-beta-xylanase [Paenibacillus tianmuensis]|nr:endo-1,4-beta-xylanase [Paenibacillus tianmuensis]
MLCFLSVLHVVDVVIEGVAVLRVACRSCILCLGREFSTLTPENDMKFQFIHPQRNVYAFAEGDSLVDFAERNGMDIHGHALVWSEANPRWLTQGNYSASELQAIMEEHVKTVVGRHKGRIKEWDVINEPLKEENFNVNLGLRDSIWFKAMGEKFLDIALRAAHEADPDAKLYINENGCEAEDDKADALYKLVQRLQSRGVPLHGIGFQLHEDIGKDGNETHDPVSVNEFKRTAKRFTDLGLEVRVSELDVNMHGKVTDTLRKKQAEYFKSILAPTKANNRFTSYAMWGFTDRYSSLQPADEYNEFGNGLIYDEHYAPKLPYYKIRDALQSP